MNNQTQSAQQEASAAHSNVLSLQNVFIMMLKQSATTMPFSIFTTVPVEATFPYAQIRRISFSKVDKLYESFLVEILIASRYKGTMECMCMMQKIAQTINFSSAKNLSEWQGLISLEYQSQTIICEKREECEGLVVFNGFALI